MTIQLSETKSVSNYSKPYVIAELGSNHNGDMKLARKLIQAASESGADCVKFQSWSKDSIFSKRVYKENHFLTDDYRDRSDTNLEKIVDDYSISENELLEMKEVAKSYGIDIASTPFSRSEADFLVSGLGARFIKVASMDLNNYPFLEYLGKKGLPILLSTGLSELSEIDRAITTIEATGNRQIVILHCVSIYPPEDSQTNLRNIQTLQVLYPEYPVGFSDHSLGTVIPIASLSLGSCVIEKHFTLDKGLDGWDHKVSATPEEMAIIVEAGKRIPEAMGTPRVLSPENAERKNAFRRSLVARLTMCKGHVVTESDIDYKRPGGGISPDEARYVIGRRLKTDIEADAVLDWSNFE